MRADTNRAWYREWMIWVMIAPPLAAVIGGLVTAFLAGGPPSMVVDDYRDFAMVTQRAGERDDAAARQQLSAGLTVGLMPADDGVEVRLTSGTGAPLPDALRFRLIHPTRAELDQTVALRLDRGVYRGVLNRPAGALDVILDSPSAEWRLIGRLPAGVTEMVLDSRAARGGDG